MTTTVSKKREFSISRKNFSEVVAVSVKIDSESMTVAAYGDARIPSVILIQEKFDRNTSASQEMRFETVHFEEFEGYKIWSCDIDEDEIKVCLVR